MLQGPNVMSSDILYISHCVPWPPDKGDRIRACYSVRELQRHHRVHLVCLARSEAEAAAASEVREKCASVRIHVLDRNRAIARGLIRFGLGQCFTTAFYGAPELERQVREVTAAVCRESGAKAEFVAMRSFRPGRPTPTHRYATAK